MAQRSTRCTLVDREDRMAAYLAGRLSAEDAESFEEHYFACDECWQELQAGLEIRAAVGRGDHAGMVPAPAVHRAPATSWRWLAAAASIALAVVVWRVLPRPAATVVPAASAPAPAAAPSVARTEGKPPTSAQPQPAITKPVPSPSRSTPAPFATPPVPVNTDLGLRSPTAAALRPLVARLADGTIRIDWQSNPKAARYRLSVYTTDGTQVMPPREVPAPPITIDPAASFSGHADERLIGQVEVLDALGATIGKSSRFVLLPGRGGGLR